MTFIKSVSVLLCISLSVMLTLIMIFVFTERSGKNPIMVGICVMAAVSLAALFYIVVHLVISFCEDEDNNIITPVIRVQPQETSDAVTEYPKQNIEMREYAITIYEDTEEDTTRIAMGVHDTDDVEKTIVVIQNP